MDAEVNKNGGSFEVDCQNIWTEFERRVATMYAEEAVKNTEQQNTSDDSKIDLTKATDKTEFAFDYVPMQPYEYTSAPWELHIIYEYD